jgi:hypothetical protein
MLTYTRVSGAIFGAVAALQLTRILLRLPVQVADFSIPLGASAFAGTLATLLAIWAFRSAKSTSR